MHHKHGICASNQDLRRFLRFFENMIEESVEIDAPISKELNVFFLQVSDALEQAF